MTTPRLLAESDRERVLEYVRIEPEMNLFIIGDIEQFGMEGPVSVYALEADDGNWDSVVCRFYGNFVCYSPSDDFDAEAMAACIKEVSGGAIKGSINGKYEVVRKLEPYFEDMELRSMFLAKCTSVHHEDIAPAPDGVTVRKLTADDYDELFELLGSMREYRGLYADDVLIAAAKEQKNGDEAHGCVTFGAFYEGEMVSTAATSAVSSEGAMVVGVGTRDDVRGNGLATSVVSELAQECFDEGKSFLCLFYENPRATAIYSRIGFDVVGRYAMLR